jgi:hypothetical protein
MKYEIDLPPDVEHSLAARASETGQDVVHLIQLAVTRFVAEEVSPVTGNGQWSQELDDRRCALIDREIAGTITVAERAELGALQRIAEQHFDEVAGPPLEGAVKLHQQILSKDDA